MENALATAAQELDEMLKSQDEKKDEPTITDELDAAAKGTLVKAEKDPEPKPKPEPEPAPAQQSASVQEGFHKSLADDQGYQEVMEASDALKSLEKAAGFGFGALQKSVAILTDQVTQLTDMVGILCKSQKQIHKSLDAQPVKIPMPFTVQGYPDRNGHTEQPSDKPSRDDVEINLTKAVEKERLEPRILGLFSSRPNDALKLVPDNIRKSYNLPDAI